MPSDSKTPWQKIYVWAYEMPCLRALDGAERLLALYRWKAGEPQENVSFCSGPLELHGRDHVDWSGFPLRVAPKAAGSLVAMGPQAAPNPGAPVPALR